MSDANEGEAQRRASRPADAVLALVIGIAFLVSAQTTRFDLHDEVNPVTTLLWLALGIAATVFSRRVWRPKLWPGFSEAIRRSGPLVTAVGWILGCITILGPSHDPHALDLRRQAQCESRLRQIGIALTLYADDHGGQYPDRPETLLASGVASLENFVCPSTRDRPATGETPADIADAIASGGHMSYVYTGKGLTKATTRPSTVLMYEPAQNHTRDNPGIHVVYADERVEYLQGETAVEFIQKMNDRSVATSSPGTAQRD